MTVGRRSRVAPMLLRIAAGAVGLGACSQEQPRRPPTEQEIHSADQDDGSRVKGRHAFMCRDGTTLLVDFKDQGNMLEVRERDNGGPLILTAPTQGLQYVAEGATATFADGELRLQQAGLTERICKRATR